eukprot:bmy_13117T0
MKEAGNRESIKEERVCETGSDHQPLSDNQQTNCDYFVDSLFEETQKVGVKCLSATEQKKLVGALCLLALFYLGGKDSLVHVDMRQSQGHPSTVSDMTVEPTITVDLMQAQGEIESQKLSSSDQCFSKHQVLTEKPIWAKTLNSGLSVQNSSLAMLCIDAEYIPHFVLSKIETTFELLSKGSDLNDGLWHSVTINARRNRITLTLDNDAASPAQDTTRMQIYSGNRYYFGGCPDNLTDSQCLNPIKAFQGCMRLIFIDNQPKDLISVQQGSLGNFSDLHIDLCSIKDRCQKSHSKGTAHAIGASNSKVGSYPCLEEKKVPVVVLKQPKAYGLDQIFWFMPNITLFEEQECLLEAAGASCRHSRGVKCSFFQKVYVKEEDMLVDLVEIWGPLTDTESGANEDADWLRSKSRAPTLAISDFIARQKTQTASDACALLSESLLTHIMMLLWASEEYDINSCVYAESSVLATVVGDFTENVNFEIDLEGRGVGEGPSRIIWVRSTVLCHVCKLSKSSHAFLPSESLCPECRASEMRAAKIQKTEQRIPSVSSFWNSNCHSIVEHALKLEDNFMLGARVQVGYVLGARERYDAICNSKIKLSIIVAGHTTEFISLSMEEMSKSVFGSTDVLLAANAMMKTLAIIPSLLSL